MMLRRRALLVPLLGALGLVKPSSARAESAPAEVLKQADAHFKQGVQLFKQARYDAALAEFRRAQELLPDWHVLFNIGRSCDELHDAACAVDAFEGYLREGKELPAERVADVQSALERLKPAVGSLRIVVVGEGAELGLDDALLSVRAAESPIRVNVGKHRVTARFGDVTDARSVEVASGVEVTVELRAPAALRPAPAVPAAAPAPSRAEPPRARATADVEPGSRGSVWIGWAASGAFLAAGVTTGALALSARGDARDIADTTGAGSELDGANRRMHRLALVSDVLGGAALVTAGVSLYFTLKKPSPEAKTAGDVSLSLAATQVRLKGTF